MTSTPLARAIAALRAGRAVGIGQTHYLSVETGSDAMLAALDPAGTAPLVLSGPRAAALGALLTLTLILTAPQLLTILGAHGDVLTHATTYLRWSAPGLPGMLIVMAATGVLSFALAPDGPGTRITMTYRVSGTLTMDAAQLAPGVDQVLASQFERFRGFANARARR